MDEERRVSKKCKDLPTSVSSGMQLVITYFVHTPGWCPPFGNVHVVLARRCFVAGIDEGGMDEEKVHIGRAGES